MRDKIITQFNKYLENINSEIIQDINNRGENILKLDILYTVGNISRRYDNFKISLLKDISPNFINKNVHGKYFPNDSSVDRTVEHSVNFIQYKINIINGELIFNNKENIYRSHVHTVVLHKSLLTIEFCTFNQNVNDNNAMGEIKQKVKLILGEIESAFAEINSIHNDFINNLNNFIESQINIRIAELKNKKSAIDKLNPFK